MVRAVITNNKRTNKLHFSFTCDKTSNEWPFFAWKSRMPEICAQYPLITTIAIQCHSSECDYSQSRYIQRHIHNTMGLHSCSYRII